MSQKHRLSIGLPIKRSDPVKILLPALLFPVIVLGQEIQPFDRLGRENVTIQAQHKRGGSSSDYDYRRSLGSYRKTMTSTKEIEVTIKQHRKEKQKPLVVEFFFIIKGESGRFAQQGGVLQLPEGEGTGTFSTSSKQDQARYVYLGISERSGDRIEGWLVRALNRERVLGIAASSPSLEELAGRPDKLKPLVAAAPSKDR
jgi:hypothetical protein